VFTGVSAAEVASDVFSLALRDSVAEEIGVQATAVSGTVAVGSGRLLLSTVTARYTVSIISGLSSDGVLSKLSSALPSVAFLSSMKRRSNLPIDSVKVLDLSQATYTPTTSPIPALFATQENEGAFYSPILIGNSCDANRIPPLNHTHSFNILTYSSLHSYFSFIIKAPPKLPLGIIAAIVGGSIAFLLIVVGGSFCYFCYKPRNDKFSPVHIDHKPPDVADLVPQRVTEEPVLI
jgi:hypothetical protein